MASPACSEHTNLNSKALWSDITKLSYLRPTPCLELNGPTIENCCLMPFFTSAYNIPNTQVLVQGLRFR